MSGYIRDTAYVSEYHADHAPARMNAGVLLNGFAPRPLDDGFAWADFGCGDGLTARALAAAHPRGTFVGIDFATESIDRAADQARAAGLDNVRFLAKDFAELTDGDVPPLDFAVMHGVLSWIDDALAARLLSYVAGKLKPGGILLAGYDALPGWGQLQPLRRAMLAETADVSGGTLARVDAALDWLDAQQRANPKFLRDNRLAAEWIDDLKRRPREYIAHEFFNETLRPFHAAEMIERMDGHGLAFAGSAIAFLNMADLAVPSALRAEFDALPDRTRFEEKRDFLRNETFRRDLYVKGAPFDDLAEWRAAQERLVIGTVEPLAGLDAAVPFGDVELRYDGPPFDALLPAVAEHAMPVAALPCEAEIEIDAARLMLAGGQVVPMPAPTEPGAVPDGAALAMPLAFNAQSIEAQAADHHMIALAAPGLGGAVVVSNLEALMLLALCRDADDPAGWAGRWLADTGAVLRDETGPLDGPGAEALLRQTLEKAVRPRLGKFRELGVVTIA